MLPLPTDLLLCLRRGADLAPLSQLCADDWQALVGTATRHALAPLLFQRLKREAIAPPGALAALRQAYYHTLAENARKFELLGQALALLGEAGVRVIPLKGAYLAAHAYGDLGLRPMKDFDLLVPRADAQRAFALLQTSGFQAERPYREEVDGVLKFHMPGLVKEGAYIELHWSLARPSRLAQLDPAALWARARPIQFQGVPAWALCPGDLLLHLALHASYGHQFYGQLRSLVDLEAVLAQSAAAIDWPAFSQACRCSQAQRGVYLALRLAACLLGAQVPPDALADLRPPDWTDLALEWAQVHLFQDEPMLSENFVGLLYQANPWQQLLALLKGLFPSRQVMSMISGLPPASWRLLALYPRYAASRITKYWGQAGLFARGDPRQALASKSDIALRAWLQMVE